MNMKLIKTMRIREIIFFGGLILAGVLWFFSPSLRSTYSDYRAKQMIYEMERPYREDTYGGATPEATYALFIAALKKGDIDLASKYFSPKRQAEWLKELEAQKEKSTLKEFISNMPRLEDFVKVASEKEYVEYAKNNPGKIVPEEKITISGREVTIPAHQFTTRIIFYQNTFTHKWKIESL